MVHGTLGAGFGHGKEFRTLATSIGLVGKMTATEPGPIFKTRTKHILKTLGAYPHKKLDVTIGAKIQTTRMIKVTCLDEAFKHEQKEEEAQSSLPRDSDPEQKEGEGAAPPQGGTTTTSTSQTTPNQGELSQFEKDAIAQGATPAEAAAAHKRFRGE